MFKDNNIRPMLLKEVDKPFNDKKYIYEVKFDGIRALIYVSKNSFKIISRNGKDITKFYPELKRMQKIVNNKKVIFDGEIVAFDNDKPSFQKLQMRNRVKEVTEKVILDIPICFICFDVLYEDRKLIDLTLRKRKEILNKYEDTDIFIKTKIYRNGIKLFKEIKKLNLEGIVAKEISSKYIPGKRVDTWIKIKNIKDGDFWVQGYVFNKEKYSLFLGEYRGDKLYYVGKVSVSKNREIINKIKKLKPMKNLFINFKEEGIFVLPKYQVVVTFLERTKDGKLRHASLK